MSFSNELTFENNLINLLRNNCGWEKEVISYPTEQDLIDNWAKILFENNKETDVLNGCPLTDSEMNQILMLVNQLKTPHALNKFINGRTVSITRDNPNDQLHFGKSVSLKIYDRMEIAGGKSRYQIVEQPRFKTNNSVYPARRGDLMLLINGMPVFHIELKKTGVPVSQAEVQIEKYMNNGVFTGVFSLVQVFVAMTPEESVYFANPGPNGKFNPDFFFHWEDVNNDVVNDWKEFAVSVLSIPMAHEMIGFYTIADDADGVLKVMRSYQYFAASEISQKVSKTNWTKAEQHGGYIWHTTGSGKTMTSFKAAQLIANSHDADKVVFLLDRIELGEQSLTNYRNFAEVTESIQSTEDTDMLIDKLKSSNKDDTLIVTSIQKMSRIKEDGVIRTHDLETIQKKRIVFIIDECHRDQKGEMHQNIKLTFPNAIYFGFTGTPDHEYTSMIFGDELHRYTIVHGIRDKNVLGFDPYKVCTYDDKKLREIIALEKCHCNSVEEAMSNDNTKKVFLYYMNKSNEKCSMLEIESNLSKSQYEREEHKEAVVNNIIENWCVRSINNKFHAIFATSSIPEAIEYYKRFKECDCNLKITAVFDPSDNNNSTSLAKMNGITEILTDYKDMFGISYEISEYARFKKDVCARLAHKKPYLNLKQEEQLDLVIVVEQLLTGFDSKWINVLYLDKVLYGMNLVQAISRTNRLFDKSEKPHGTVVYYRFPHTMEQNLIKAMDNYSGNKPFGVFVDKLQKNLTNMNSKFGEIKDLFEKEGIMNFKCISQDDSWKKKFAKTFAKFNKYLESAKIQGFTWQKNEYYFEDTLEVVKMLINETTYLILVQRYKELFKYVPGGDDIPYDIDTHITEIQTDTIDDDYINSKFILFVRNLNQNDPIVKEKVLNALHSSFAYLTQVDQKYAKLILHDIESGKLILNESMTLRDYITEYKTQDYNDQIHKFAIQFGLDEQKLRAIMNMHVTEANINSHGRYQKLKQTVDINKAKSYFETKKGKELSLAEVAILLDQLMRRFLIEGGFDI